MMSLVLTLSHLLLVAAKNFDYVNQGLNFTLIVNTTSGTFSPHLPGSYPGVASFPDIPYAENPTGPLRFAPPVPIKVRDDGVVHATRLPAGCFQYVLPALKETIGEVLEETKFQRGDYANTTEDCLHLSIFAPRAAGERAALETAHMADGEKGEHSDLLPVIIWIHGGGYALGGINTPYELAPSWVQRSQSHIVVQVQYRLNLLGLPNAAGLASNGTENSNLNLSLLDQRLAVEWVRDNIALLGGDPARITLWGESAGGYATDGYLFAWAADPIVSGVIASSGNALAIEGATGDATNHSTFSRAAERLGCGGISPADELACMRAVPASAIQEYIQGSVATADGLSFATIADNVTVFTDYAGRISARDPKLFAAQVPVLIGTNANEGSAVVPYDFDGSATATQIPTALEPIADAFGSNLQQTTTREVSLRAAVGATTYQYLYAGNFSNVSPRPWLGAYHTAELPMVFGTYNISGAPATNFQVRVSERMQDLYLAFARDPKNDLKELEWPLASGVANRPEIMEWAADGKVEQKL
ncbi:Alpha/Beta hydrolase protein [Whalleya microplaca]|nr:Alpha/Beta hydrolase protein [Whalleya microplaca]